LPKSAPKSSAEKVAILVVRDAIYFAGIAPNAITATAAAKYDPRFAPFLLPRRQTVTALVKSTT
jgi:hypothetical protein